MLNFRVECSAGAPQWTRFRVNVAGSYATSAAVLVSQAADYEVRVNGAAASGARIAIDGSSLPVVVDGVESSKMSTQTTMIGESLYCFFFVGRFFFKKKNLVH